MTKNKISLYLVKEHIVNVDDLFKEGFTVLREYSENKMLYFNPSDSIQPKWLDEFFHITNDSIWNSNSKAVLLIKRTIDDVNRSFVITFGLGIHMLKDNTLEERFGLITLLNLIGEDQIKRINKSNIGGSKKISDEQVPRATSINEFGFQIDRDLLKKAYGKINDEQLGKCLVVGGSLFGLHQEVDINNIGEFADYCYRTYLKQDYKRQFDWIDNISPIKDKELIIILDDILVEKINNREYDCVMLSQPEIISWSDVKCFKYSGERTNTYDDINLDSFVAVYPPFDCIEQIKNKKIHIIPADGSPSFSDWSAYKCLSAEIEYRGKHYCLSDRKWYMINDGFVESTEKKYQQIPQSDFFLPDYNHKDEGVYNQDVANSSDELFLLDRKNVIYGGGHSKVEICDILTSDKRIIHIKHNYSSSCMSHLFSQATVSSELLKVEDFRGLANEKIDEESFKFNSSFRADEYTVVLGIIDMSNDDLPHLPFFSKVSIQYAAQRIHAFGYKVEIMKIKNIKKSERQQETAE